MDNLANIVTLIAYAGFVGMLCYIAIQDSRTKRIPNRLLVILGGIWLAWMLIMVFVFMANGVLPSDALFKKPPLGAMSFVTGFLSGAVFGIISLLATTAFESITESFGMGGGDIKLIAVTALFMGWERELVAILLACLIILVQTVVAGRQRSTSRRGSSKSSILKQTVAFGPAICIGCFLMLVLGMLS